MSIKAMLQRQLACMINNDMIPSLIKEVFLTCHIYANYAFLTLTAAAQDWKNKASRWL